MKKFACNEKGFFLVEHLLAVVITSLLAAASVALIHTVRAYQVNPIHLTQHEVETLATRLQQEAAYATAIQTDPEQLHLEIDGNLVSYVFQNNRISRQVNGRGGEIALYNVSGLHVAPGPNQSATLTITSMSGHAYEIYLIAFLPEVHHE